ncbi:endothelin-converting enzyme 1-like [Amblyomma americanum]
MEKLRKEYKADSEWLFSQSMVTAFYNPSLNEIVYPMGGLQFPFYELGLPKSINFGAVGAVIAHEITHSITGIGAFYHTDGRMQNWWTNSTKIDYKNSTECFVKQFENIFDQEANMTLIGTRTLDENIADSVGLHVTMKSVLGGVGEQQAEALVRELRPRPAAAMSVRRLRHMCGNGSGLHLEKVDLRSYGNRLPTSWKCIGYLLGDGVLKLRSRNRWRRVCAREERKLSGHLIAYEVFDLT